MQLKRRRFYKVTTRIISMHINWSRTIAQCRHVCRVLYLGEGTYCFQYVKHYNIRDAVMWHVVPLIIITVLAEIARAMAKYNWVGEIVGVVLMSFSSFGYYGQIWFNRAYTYECAVEEMPAGYGDTLMSVSPVWAFPVVVAAGIIVSVLITNIYRKKHTGIDKSRK